MLETCPVTVEHREWTWNQSHLCHDPHVGITKENGPGIGFWISLGIGAVAGGGALALGAGWLLALGIFVVVSVAMALLLS